MTALTTTSALSSTSSRMNDLDNEEKAIESALHTIQSQLATLSHTIQSMKPLMELSNISHNSESHSTPDRPSVSSTHQSSLPPLNRSKLYACLAYTLSSLEYIYLRTVNHHEFYDQNKKDLDRIKKYMNKINQCESEKRSHETEENLNNNVTTSVPQQPGDRSFDKRSDRRDKGRGSHKKKRKHDEKQVYQHSQQRQPHGNQQQYHKQNKHVKL